MITSTTRWLVAAGARPDGVGGGGGIGRPCGGAAHGHAVPVDPGLDPSSELLAASRAREWLRCAYVGEKNSSLIGFNLDTR